MFTRFLKHAFQAALIRDCGYTRKITSKCSVQCKVSKEKKKVKIAVGKKSESQSEKKSK